MIQQREMALAELYDLDETAWLDAMVDLIRRGAVRELDYQHLGEYLADTARRDRREVESRLTVLILHVLKWIHQPEQRSRSWQGTIVEQRQELARLVDRSILKIHAESVLADAYAKAVERALAETALPAETFRAESVFSLEQLLSFDPADH